MRQPMMARAAWLVLRVGVLAVSAVIAVGVIRNQHTVDLSRQVAGTASKSGVQLDTVLSLKPTRRGFDVVAKVSILNTTDQGVNYVGLPCYAPAPVTFVSNLAAPAGPAYSPAAATMRAHVMDYRRSLDQAHSRGTQPARPTSTTGFTRHLADGKRPTTGCGV